MIVVIINGKKETLEKELTLEEMLESLGYKESSFAVAINRVFTPLNEYKTKIIKDGDEVEILAPMVGG
jgi:sulfur carrier protein